MMASVACDDPEPEATGNPAAPSPTAALASPTPPNTRIAVPDTSGSPTATVYSGPSTSGVETQLRPTPTPTPIEDPPEISETDDQPGVSRTQTGETLIIEPHFPCGPLLGVAPFPYHFVLWTPDSSQLVFSGGGAIWKVDVEGSDVRMVLDANPGSHSLPGSHEFLYGFHADLSSDGAQLVYTSCEFPTEYEQFSQERLDQLGAEWYERGKYNYEIALSPDGDLIAFVSNSGNHPDVDRRGQQLYTMSADGSDVQIIASQLIGVALYPPVWSPDGQRLAFVVNEGGLYPGEHRVLYTVRSDGSELVRIGETTVPPTWSPDGKRLAFVRGDGQESIIHTVRFDATDLRRVWSSGPEDKDSPQSISQMSWSPDGSELLFIFTGKIYFTGEIYTVGPDGSGLRRLDIAGRPGQAAWSPDGSRVAIYYPSNYNYESGQVLTIASDGTDLRILAEEDSNGRFHMATEVRQ